MVINPGWGMRGRSADKPNHLSWCGGVGAPQKVGVCCSLSKTSTHVEAEPLVPTCSVKLVTSRDAHNHSHYVDDDSAAGGDQHHMAIDLIVVAYDPLDG